MDFWAYLRFACIILFTGALGGAIAHLGNQLGRYIGRKKMSIFKLRPRHTSMVITILTGVMIASVTLGLATAFSEPIRIIMINPKAYKAKIEYLEDMIRRANQLRQTDLVYKKQDVILSAVIKSNNDVEKMETALKEIIAKANEAALFKSTAIAQDQNVEFTPPKNGRLVGYIPENLNSVARELSRLQGDYIIFARANQHTTLGDVFYVELGNPLPNHLIFKKGELIRQIEINGKEEYPNIYDNLLRSIKDEITQEALIRGLFPDPEDKSIGEYDDKQLRNLAMEIKKQEKKVAIGFYAVEDTYVRGPLKLKILKQTP